MRKNENQEGIITLLGTDTRIDGTLEFHGAVRVDGDVKGNILSKQGTVILGEKGTVNATICVDVAIIMGVVYGSIEARERIEIRSPGRVVGDISAPNISIEQGGIFHGKCSMKIRPHPLKNI